MTPQEFYDKYAPYASQLAANLEFNSPDVFLAQWALETAWGSSELAVKYNNMAGINYNGVACYRAVGGFAGYTSLDQFVLGATYVFKLNGYGYPEFLATKDGTFAEQATALGKSDWAASHYGNPPGSDLQAFYDEMPHETVAPTGETTTSRKTYTVQSGDTLSGIAAANGLTLAEIESYNPQIADPNLIHPGEVVYLSPDTTVTTDPTTTTDPAPTTQTGLFVYYTPVVTTTEQVNVISTEKGSRGVLVDNQGAIAYAGSFDSGIGTGSSIDTAYVIVSNKPCNFEVKSK